MYFFILGDNFMKIAGHVGLNTVTLHQKKFWNRSTRFCYIAVLWFSCVVIYQIDKYFLNVLDWLYFF